MPGGWEWLIIVGVLLLLFGAKRLPDMARSIGQSARVFKGEMKGLKDDETKTDQTAKPAEPAASEPVATPAELPSARSNGVAPQATPAASQDARPAGQ